MKLKSTINITNGFARELTFHLEPWGEQIPMPPGKTFAVCAEAESEGEFEIEFRENEIFVWAWTTSVAEVYCDGEAVSAAPAAKMVRVP